MTKHLFILAATAMAASALPQAALAQAPLTATNSAVSAAPVAAPAAVAPTAAAYPAATAYPAAAAYPAATAYPAASYPPPMPGAVAGSVAADRDGDGIIDGYYTSDGMYHPNAAQSLPPPRLASRRGERG